MNQGKIIKQFTSRKGNQVVFRYPKPEDLGAMLKFANDLIAEDTYVLLSGKKLTLPQEKKFLKEELEKIKKSEAIRVVVEVNGKFAGNAGVKRGILRQHHTGEAGIALVPQFREEGIGVQLLDTLISESRQLGLRLLTIDCFENNERALHVYEKLGFRKIGIIPGGILFKGEYIGEVKMYLPLKK